MSGSAANAAGRLLPGTRGRAGRLALSCAAGSPCGGGSRSVWAKPRPRLLHEILPHAGGGDAEPVIAVFAGLLHLERGLGRQDAVELDLLGRSELAKIGLGEIGPYIDLVLAFADAGEARGHDVEHGGKYVAARS